MNAYDYLRFEAMPLLLGRLTTINALWETGLEQIEQQEAMQLEAHRLIATAVQAQLSTIFQAGRELEQLLKANMGASSAPCDARTLIAAALDALRAAVAQAAAEYSGPTSSQGGDADASEAAEDEQPLAGLRVLLVEDSGDLAAGFREGLRMVGCTRVVHCGIIAAAQRLLAPGQPLFDIALIDHNLGRERGSTLASWMRLQPHLVTTKRVSYSATSRERIVGESQPGDFHALLELRGLRQLIDDLARLAVDIPRSRVG
jgi:hypothetical protein